MRKLICSIVVSLVAVAPAGAEDLGELAARSIHTHAQIAKIHTQMEEELGDRRMQAQALGSALEQVDLPPMSASEIKSLDAKIAKETETLAQFRKLGTSDDSLGYTYGRIMELSLTREAGALKNSSERADFRNRIQKQYDRVMQEINTIEAPFNAKIQRITDSVADDNEALTKALSQYFNEFDGLSVKHVNANMHSAFAGLEWFDQSGERVAWAHVRIRSERDIMASDRREMLDNTFPVRTANDNSLWVWAGNFLITFVPVEEDLKSESALKDSIFKFVDLEALAQVNAEPTGALAEVFED